MKEQAPKGAELFGTHRHCEIPLKLSDHSVLP